ncbi:MAG: hypothetical protein GXP55_19865 [Deltaproteobacteria bacterium]|nr:hypothetical protein [Deltaproteobacteria bacterium]
MNQKITARDLNQLFLDLRRLAAYFGVDLDEVTFRTRAQAFRAAGYDDPRTYVSRDATDFTINNVERGHSEVLYRSPRNKEILYRLLARGPIITLISELDGKAQNVDSRRVWHAEETRIIAKLAQAFPDICGEWPIWVEAEQRWILEGHPFDDGIHDRMRLCAQFEQQGVPSIEAWKQAAAVIPTVKGNPDLEGQIPPRSVQELMRWRRTLRSK